MRYRHTIILFFVTMPICVLLRTLQLIFTIDEATGFIKQQYSEISVIIMFIICAAVAAVGLLGFTVGGIKADKDKLKPVLAVVSALAGGMFIYDSVTGLALLGTGTWHDILLVFLGILSAFVFIAYGLKNVYRYNLPSMMLIIPVFYYVIKLINIFVSTSALALVTENIFLLFTNGVLLLFMLEFAKFENQVDGNKKSPKKLLGVGVAAVMLCAVSTVPKIIAFSVNDIEISSRDISNILLMVSVGIFVLSFIMCNFSDKEKTCKKRVARHLAE